MQKLRAPLLPGVVALALSTAYLIALLAAEKQPLIVGLLVFAVVAVLAAHYLGLAQFGEPKLPPTGRMCFGVYAILAACVVAAFFHDNHFVLLLFVTLLLYTVATLGLNIRLATPECLTSLARRSSHRRPIPLRCSALTLPSRISSSF